MSCPETIVLPPNSAAFGTRGIVTGDGQEVHPENVAADRQKDKVAPGREVAGVGCGVASQKNDPAESESVCVDKLLQSRHGSICKMACAGDLPTDRCGSRFNPMKTTFKPVVVPVKEMLPPAELRVIVVCKGFRCLGYVDRQGIWRDGVRQRELHDVIGWLDRAG